MQWRVIHIQRNVEIVYNSYEELVKSTQSGNGMEYTTLDVDLGEGSLLLSP